MKAFMVAVSAVALTVAAAGYAASPAFAQCATCNADKSKADRAATNRVAKNQKNAANKETMRRALGNGTAARAANKAKNHYDKAEKASKED